MTCWEWWNILVTVLWKKFDICRQDSEEIYRRTFIPSTYFFLSRKSITNVYSFIVHVVSFIISFARVLLYFFQSTFYGGMKESKETEVELKETSVAAFMRILPFIYIYLSIRIFDEPYFLNSFYSLAYIYMNIPSIYSESVFSIAFKISSIFVSNHKPYK